MAEYSSLREANQARELERDPHNLITPLYRAVELGGEIGACLTCLNIVKKIERERLGLPGSRASLADLANEIGDIIIATDMLAAEYGLTIADCVQRKFNADSVKLGLKTKLRLLPKATKKRK
jgi:hypothetical protein